MPITLKIEGLDKFRDDVHRGAAEIPGQIRYAMAKAVNAVKNTAQPMAPFKTGNLRRSVYTEVQNNGFKGIIGVDANAAPYGIYMEYGTRPHAITAVNKRALANVRANIVFGKIVQHPGTAARPFMAPALEQNTDIIKGYFSDAILKIVQIMAGR